MKNNIDKGSDGENIAKNYLQSKGGIIKEMNFRHSRYEVDLIIVDKNTLVFVEVKTRINNSFGEPEEAVNAKKIDNVQKAANYYQEKINWHGKIRFDIIAVTLTPRIDVLHIIDAF
ncbi:YraN family protein [Aureibacter tunicatorum]|uniref:UPF0102 protein HNQ88_003304 n=1 Tax=Aureibacter tunicatorum TaxID=866807 RepID=A0AAE4BTX7_9BACT|nr:YraN family protein [Aureibacter tunicatorum]MDR6240238.1 putative endonuclease [Aureibacter tunicatorum]BDD05881.1 UPF0102 protein [Aureibacter tunicatorum]